MTRTELIEQMERAETTEEVEAAQRARGARLRAHPDDETVIEHGASLSTLRDALSASEELAIQQTLATSRP